jgi:hypothetical protein
MKLDGAEPAGLAQARAPAGLPGWRRGPARPAAHVGEDPRAGLRVGRRCGHRRGPRGIAGAVSMVYVVWRIANEVHHTRRRRKPVAQARPAVRAAPRRGKPSISATATSSSGSRASLLPRPGRPRGCSWGARNMHCYTVIGVIANPYGKCGSMGPGGIPGGPEPRAQVGLPARRRALRDGGRRAPTAEGPPRGWATTRPSAHPLRCQTRWRAA